MNDSFCTSCKNDSNADLYNKSGSVCYNCSVGDMPGSNNMCAACPGGLFYNRTRMECANGCMDQDFWNPVEKKCANCAADSYFKLAPNRRVEPEMDCMKCNGGNMTKNRTDYYNRTAKMC